MSSRGEVQAISWEVEAWRGAAAWLVVYAHYWSAAAWSPDFLRFAFTGVDLFFVLSGFVFAPYFFGKSLPARPFWIRRFFRIYPAYVLALLVYMGLRWSEGGALLYVAEHFTFMYLQSREMAFYYNPVFWSLPSEVEFYLVLPVLAYLLRRWRRTLLLAGVGALLLRVALGYASDRAVENSAFILMHHLPGMGVEFLLGAAAWRISRQALGDWLRTLLFGLGLAGWLGLAFMFGQLGDAGIDQSWARGQMSWLAALCFALMLAGCLGACRALGIDSEKEPQRGQFLPDLQAHSPAMGQKAGEKWTAAALLQPMLPKSDRLLATAATDRAAPAPWLHASALWAGRLSYGVYLFHVGALRLLEPYRETLAQLPFASLQTVAVLLTLVLAWAAYVMWENPWRQWGRQLAADGAPRRHSQVGIRRSD